MTAPRAIPAGLTGFAKFSSVLGAGLALALAIAAPAAAQDKVTIRWGNAAGASVPHMLSYVISLDPALETKYKIHLELTNFNGNSNNCIAALIAGSVDVCQNGITSGIAPMGEGADFKSFAVMGGWTAEVTLGKAVFEKLKVPLNAPIADRLKALKGLRLVGSGTSTPNYIMLDYLLKRVGMTIGDIQFRTLVDTAAMNEGIRNGQIDGAFWSAGGLSPVQMSGNAVRFIALARGDVPDVKDVPLTAVFTTTAWLEKNKDVAARAKAAMKEVVANLKKDPVGYSKAYKEKMLPALDDATWKDVIEASAPAFFDDQNGTAAGWNFWIEPLKADSPKGDFTKAVFEKAFVKVD